MHLKATWLAPVALAATVVADVDVEPCAQITQMVADANQSKSTLILAHNPSRMQLTVIVSAKVSHNLAYRCLMSMPFEPSRAVTFLDQVRKILEFQSTVDILRRMLNQPCFSSSF